MPQESLATTSFTPLSARPAPKSRANAESESVATPDQLRATPPSPRLRLIVLSKANQDPIRRALSEQVRSRRQSASLPRPNVASIPAPREGIAPEPPPPNRAPK